MSIALEKEVKALQEAVNNLSQTRPNLNKNLGVIITIIVLSAGVVGSWFTQKSVILEMKQNLTKLEKSVENQDSSIQDIKLKSVKDSSDVAHIKEKVDSMDQKLDKLLESRR